MAADAQALRDLHALLASDGHAATFASLATYRRHLLSATPRPRSGAVREMAELIASDAYAITFQSIRGYRTALLLAITPYMTPISYLHMNDLLAQLRTATSLPACSQAADLIESLQERITLQQTLLDKCASTLVEAITTEDGIDATEAEACVDAIRADFGEVGKTTTEELLEKLYNRIAAAAGLPPNTAYDPIHVLDQFRACIAVQSKNGAYLEFLLPLVYWRTPDESMRLRVSAPGQVDRFLTFADGTSWPQALDKAMALPTDPALAA